MCIHVSGPEIEWEHIHPLEPVYEIANLAKLEWQLMVFFGQAGRLLIVVEEGKKYGEGDEWHRRLLEYHRIMKGKREVEKSR